MAPNAEPPARRHLLGTSSLRRAGFLIAIAVALATVGMAPPAYADEWRDRQWHLEFFNIDEVHKISQGDGVTVAVVDSGVDASHPDLVGNVLDGHDLTSEGDAQTDTDGHGTAMAANIAGHGHGPGGRDGILGLAPKAKILPIRMHTGSGEDDEHVPAGGSRGIEMAAWMGADIINYSVAGNVAESTITEVLESDVVLVAGVGNTKQGHNTVQAPASIPGVIAVSGVDRNGHFSEQSAQGPEVVLAAPMIDIASASAGKGGRYGVFSGTSDATSFVSAIAALIKAKYPDISANGIINRLIQTADDKGPPGRDPQYGFGVVNPLKALTADIPDIDYNPLIQPSASPTAIASPSNTAKATVKQPDDSGYLIPLLLIAGGVTTLTLLMAGGLLVARNRRRRPQPAAVPGQVPFGAPPPTPPPTPPPQARNHYPT